MISASEAARRRERGATALAEGNRDDLPELRVSVVGTFNLDLWPPFLVEALERAGLYAHVLLAPFGQLPQELLNPSAEAEAVVVVPAADDLLGAPEGELERLVAAALERRPEATFFAVAFGPEDVPAPHVLDPAAPELAKLVRAGVLVVAASKNNPGDVDEVLEKHPAMVLRRDDFAALRVSWEDKATSLRELAGELDLGLDSFVFLDDNPVERDWVRAALPEVLVPELPHDPVERPGFLRRAPWFRRISVTGADAARTESYQAQSRRRDLRRAVASFDDFLAELGQEVVVEPLHEGSVARAAQLAQRTNQFNLTTRRYTVPELEAIAADPSAEAYTLALSDRFGDSGITGLAILRFLDGTAEVDTFLLSCRVLGRRVEDAFLAFLAERARERGARTLVGRYVESPRNEQARSFYPERGFEPRGDAFRLDLDRGRLEPPAGVAVKAVARA